MASIWDSFDREAQVSTGGDWPEIPDDLYEAKIIAVSEPQDRPDPFNPERMKTDFFLTWQGRDEDWTLRQYLSLPETYINDGYVNEKSNLYKVMDALGFDMTGRFVVAPREWVGQQARIMVENKEPKAGGDARPRITAVKPRRSKAQPPAGRQPVGAAASSQKPTDDWDD